MRATILPKAIILTKAHRGVVSILAKRCTQVFLKFTTQLYQYFSVLVLFALFSDKTEVFLPKYSQIA